MNVKNDPKMIIGENLEIGKNVIMTGNIRIGNNCKIGNNILLNSVLIGDNSVIQDNSVIGYNTVTGHYYDDKQSQENNIGLNIQYHITIGKNVLIRTGSTIYLDVQIDDNCWINHNAIIREKVNISKQSLVKDSSKTIKVKSSPIGKIL